MVDVAKFTADLEAGKGCPELKGALDGMADPDARLGLVSEIAGLNQVHRNDNPGLPVLEVHQSYPDKFGSLSAGILLTTRDENLSVWQKIAMEPKERYNVIVYHEDWNVAFPKTTRTSTCD